MPELPEVETIKLSLGKKILGLKLKEIQILNAKSFIGDSEVLKGAKVVKVWRRAKVLGIDLVSLQPSAISSQPKNKSLQAAGCELLSLLFHLKMSGQVILLGENRFVGGHPTKDMLGELPNKHTRVIFEFSDPFQEQSKASKSKLYFNDQRKFGWIKLVKTADLKAQNYGYKNEIGPEPLEKEFTWELLKDNLLKHKTTAIKVAILDSSVVAGVGNIYACEALLLAKINPQFKVKDLSDEQIKDLHKAIMQALSDGIKYGGSTKTHFVDSDGKKGLFLDYANVYNRAGKPCKVCGTKIEKIKLGGRGTFFCPICQY